MTSMIDGIVFDKDGTLFDFRRTWEAWTQRVLVRLAPSPDHVEVMGAAIGFDTLSQRFARDSVVIAGTPEEIVDALAPHLPEMSQPDILMTLNAEAAQAPLAEAAPLGSLMRDLKARGLRLGVATNDAEAPARAHLNAAGILDDFDFVAGCDSGHGAKPGTGQLMAFAQQLLLNPARCVMVGDSLHDLHAGQSAGFRTVGVLTGMAGADDLGPHATVVLPHIGHLPKWLDSLT